MLVQQLRALRDSRWVELLECTSSKFEWLRDLVETPKGKRILATLGEAVIFRDHYWDCKPKEEKEYEAWLTYDRNGVLHHREFCMGIGSSRSKVFANPVQMVNRLHPNYIVSALNAITIGKVWKWIECAVKWGEEIFDIRRQCSWWRRKHRARS